MLLFSAKTGPAAIPETQGTVLTDWLTGCDSWAA